MTKFEFQQVDVFSATPFKGNPVAVVLGADALTTEQMAAFASWTNLSETTFLLKPTSPEADYRVRIFTPETELPFAGHPTLGSCHAWLTAGNHARGKTIIQECGIGLVPIRRTEERLAFVAPDLLRSGPVDEALLSRVAHGLKIPLSSIQTSAWTDNGPGWLSVLLGSREEVLALEPDYGSLADLSIGVIGPWNPATDGMEAQFEVRAFAMSSGVNEDPVTGSLNAGLAQWLIGSGQAPQHYIASQGTRLGRNGLVHVDYENGKVWVGGSTITRITGTLQV
ncbi:phenazine biosynthesis PhzC/PhzF protein [Acetobacter aceti NRIC 0242]|uniref:Phenazine biosynthesis protein PhzF n=1 Tax=Acetobacter aceti NBRC 14818 TaxID=887700 RepID=A0AB33ID40_ACEAC|nr:PhzF family phenazine biosynthesis protein [Acetobacter aceti]TCS30760.1 PhzF family phenazine biosynthesis protein [Acetobacter aceti NBRC 14818]BCK75922.1 phenazine biosynthesis protein PhzF [Acetobacter aceti NBRC 14818]GAN58523.1 phenazine biosynthesis PhzC/PhzF [Acetobacter aceti NBRC 14818]GBO81735.1 phenazine biosynthesis PhzC/PhzF protein [Acetobacter aceti NRIC 0242]